MYGGTTAAGVPMSTINPRPVDVLSEDGQHPDDLRRILRTDQREVIR